MAYNFERLIIAVLDEDYAIDFFKQRGLLHRERNFYVRFFILFNILLFSQTRDLYFQYM